MTETGGTRRGLQNHPGDLHYPAGGLPARWRLVLAASPAGLNFLFMGMLYGVSITWLCLSSPKVPPLPWVVAPGVLITGMGAALVWRVLHCQRAEQRRYYALTGMPALTAAQQAALALDAPNVFDFGGWVETLEYMPCERRLRDAGHAGAKFKHLSVQSIAATRRDLEDWWGVRTPAQAQATINELFAGMHSVRFAEEGMEDHALVSFLAERMGVPEERIVRLLYPQGGKPPQFVLGFDWWRAVFFARGCYMADLVDERQAWEWILRTDAMARSVFDSFDAFYFCEQVGQAYWCRESEGIQARALMYTRYAQHCQWPVSRIPWRPIESLDHLPESVRSGFEPAA